jgi:tetratricopeptide (TPR) repeat protein
LACFLFAGPVAADTLVVLGEGETTVEAFEARGSAVLGPEETRAELGRRAGAGPELAAVRALAAQGREAYVQTDFSGAIDALGRASAAAFAAGQDGIPLAELAAIHLDLGIALLARGSRAEAEREIGLALRLAPALAVDRSLHGPPVWRAVERVRADQSRARALDRTLVTEPDGGTIQLDARAPVPSPLTVPDLAQGPHAVVARRRGHPSVTVRIDVSPSTQARIVIPLPPASVAKGALDALDAGDLEQAAALAREALDADAALAVRSGAHGLEAAWAPREGDVRSLTAAGPAELVAALFPEPAPLRRVPLVPRGPEHVAAPSPEPERGGGLPWWVWAGGGAIVAGVATAAVIFLARPDEPSPDRLLVAELVE